MRNVAKYINIRNKNDTEKKRNRRNSWFGSRFFKKKVKKIHWESKLLFVLFFPKDTLYFQESIKSKRVDPLHMYYFRGNFSQGPQVIFVQSALLGWLGGAKELWHYGTMAIRCQL